MQPVCKMQATTDPVNSSMLRLTFAGSGKLVRARWPEPGLKLNFAA